MEQKWGAVCVERRKHGSGRGLRKPALVIMQGGAFLLYYVGSGQYGTGTFIHCGDPCKFGNLSDSYWIQRWYTGGRWY